MGKAFLEPNKDDIYKNLRKLQVGDNNVSGRNKIKENT